MYEDDYSGPDATAPSDAGGTGAPAGDASSWQQVSQEQPVSGYGDGGFEAPQATPADAGTDVEMSFGTEPEQAPYQQQTSYEQQAPYQQQAPQYGQQPQSEQASYQQQPQPEQASYQQQASQYGQQTSYGQQAPQYAQQPQPEQPSYQQQAPQYGQQPQPEQPASPYSTSAYRAPSDSTYGQHESPYSTSAYRAPESASQAGTDAYAGSGYQAGQQQYQSQYGSTPQGYGYQEPIEVPNETTDIVYGQPAHAHSDSNEGPSAAADRHEDPATAAVRGQHEGKKAKSKSSGSGGGAKQFIWGIVGVVAGAAIVFIALFATGSLGSSGTTSTSSNGTINITTSSTDATTAQAVAAKVLPSVVSIDVYEETTTYSLGSLFGYSDGTEETTTEQTSTGSGVIISEDGYIVTNYHVIAEGTIYIVYFDDDTSCEAEVVGYDDSSDIAVLKVDKTGLTAIEVGDSSEVTVGDWVMTAGSPFGLTKSVSAGIVSALYRNETLENSYGSSFYVNMIQVDAGVNPGNSGGALVNDEGELIGICTLTASYSGDFSGVGFAIPSNYVMNIAESIIENGYAEHPYIGVSVGTVDASTQSYYGTTAEYGAYVASVVEGGPADTAGIQVGDVIVSMDGEAITTSSELIIDVRSKEIGDTVELGIIRNGTEMTVTVTLGSDSESIDSESSE